MHKLSLFVTLILMGTLLCAQDLKKSLSDDIQKYRLSFNYEYVITGIQDVSVSGTAVVQKDCFRIEGAGLLILCDAENVWTLDLEGKEAYVESAGPMDYADYISDIQWEGNDLVGTANEPTSGAIIDFRLYNIVKSPSSGDLSLFTPSSELFEDSSDWIITDLR